MVVEHLCCSRRLAFQVCDARSAAIRPGRVAGSERKIHARIPLRRRERAGVLIDLRLFELA